MRITNWIRKLAKKRRFQKNSIHHESLSVGPKANCVSENKNNIVIGKNCEILGTLCSVGDGKITIGDHTQIRMNAFVGCVDEIRIGSCVGIAPNCTIYDNNTHPLEPARRKQMYIDGFYGDAWKWTHADHAPVIIEDNVWIGEGCAILKGVTIGEGSVVGCRSVVTKDVPPYSVVAGNPAKVVKSLEH